MHSERRIHQDIGDIRIAQQVHIATHHQRIHRTTQSCIKVHKHFSIYQTLFSTGSVEQHVVFRQHRQIHFRTAQIAKIDCTINRERILTGGKNSKFVEHQTTVLNLYGTVVERKPCSRLTGEDRHAVQNQVTIDQWLIRISGYVQSTIHITRKVNNLIRYKSIGYL